MYCTCEQLIYAYEIDCYECTICNKLYSTKEMKGVTLEKHIVDFENRPDLRE